MAQDDKSTFGQPTYGITRRFQGLAFSDAIAATKEALGKEGFGVLTEIDVKATLKKKLDIDFRNYVILGACNPPFAHQSLMAEPAIGLLLPCNVVVTEEAGSTVVSAIEPLEQFKVVGRAELEPIAREVGRRLRRAVEAIGQ